MFKERRGKPMSSFESKPFINALCDQPVENGMTKARFKIFTMKKNTPKVQSLPPTEPNLYYHILRILRVHLQIMLWKAANCKALPDDSYDITQYDWLIKDGIPVPKVAEGAHAPPELIDVIRCQC